MLVSFDTTFFWPIKMGCHAHKLLCFNVFTVYFENLIKLCMRKFVNILRLSADIILGKIHMYCVLFKMISNYLEKTRYLTMESIVNKCNNESLFMKPHEYISSARALATSVLRCCSFQLHCMNLSLASVAGDAEIAILLWEQVFFVTSPHHDPSVCFQNIHIWFLPSS